MLRTILSLTLLSTAAFGQYKSEPAGPPPSELAPSISAALAKQGMKILNASGSPVLEIWLRQAAPSGPKSAEDAVTLPTIPMGALIGAVRWDIQGADRRGQPIKPGVYTLRYALQPVNGDHQGTALQRDFALMVPAADDKDPASAPSFEEVVKMSTKASNSPHPAVLSISSGSGAAGFTKEGEHDWTLNTKMGDLPVAIILIGKAEA